jgi:hypothetical protein
MMKLLTRLLLGAGRLPVSVRGTLEAEGINFLAEGLHGTITFLNYRAPGRYSNWKRSWFVGAIALTSTRLVAYRGRLQLMDVPYNHPSYQALKVTVDTDDRLCIAFDVSAFHADRSGTIELRFRTPVASMLCNLIEERMQ